MSDQLRAMLESIVATGPVGDDSDATVYEQCGGNFDDAYAYGYDHGRYETAKAILALMESK